jgi:hypothetical protein
MFLTIYLSITSQTEHLPKNANNPQFPNSLIRWTITLTPPKLISAQRRSTEYIDNLQANNEFQFQKLKTFRHNSSYHIAADIADSNNEIAVKCYVKNCEARTQAENTEISNI